MALIDSGCRLRLEPETVRLVRQRPRCGLLIRQPVGLTDRSVQFFSVSVVSDDDGHGKDDISVDEKVPLTCMRVRCRGQLIVGCDWDCDWDCDCHCDCSSVMLVVRGSRRVVSLVRLLMALARLTKGTDSPTRERSRYRRLWHFARAANALTLH